MNLDVMHAVAVAVTDDGRKGTADITTCYRSTVEEEQDREVQCLEIRSCGTVARIYELDNGDVELSVDDPEDRVASSTAYSGDNAWINAMTDALLIPERTQIGILCEGRAMMFDQTQPLPGVRTSSMRIQSRSANTGLERTVVSPGAI